MSFRYPVLVPRSSSRPAEVSWEASAITHDRRPDYRGLERWARLGWMGDIGVSTLVASQVSALTGNPSSMIIRGFVGAGKTTLGSSILRAAEREGGVGIEINFQAGDYSPTPDGLRGHIEDVTHDSVARRQITNFLDLQPMTDAADRPRTFFFDELGALSSQERDRLVPFLKDLASEEGTRVLVGLHEDLASNRVAEGLGFPEHVLAAPTPGGARELLDRLTRAFTVRFEPPGSDRLALASNTYREIIGVVGKAAQDACARSDASGVISDALLGQALGRYTADATFFRFLNRDLYVRLLEDWPYRSTLQEDLNQLERWVVSGLVGSGSNPEQFGLCGRSG